MQVNCLALRYAAAHFASSVMCNYWKFIRLLHSILPAVCRLLSAAIGFVSLFDERVIFRNENFLYRRSFILRLLQ